MVLPAVQNQTVNSVHTSGSAIIFSGGQCVYLRALAGGRQLTLSFSSIYLLKMIRGTTLTGPSKEHPTVTCTGPIRLSHAPAAGLKHTHTHARTQANAHYQKMRSEMPITDNWQKYHISNSKMCYIKNKQRRKMQFNTQVTMCLMSHSCFMRAGMIPHIKQ